MAHEEIDLKNPKTNRNNAGFTDQERQKFTDLLAAGFIDTYRYFYPDTEGYIPGGLTGLRPGRRTLTGVSTILCIRVSGRSDWSAHPFIPK